MGTAARMIYHFQFAGPAGWETVGSGIGDGEEAAVEAFDDLRALAGGDLPRGEYRCIPATAKDAAWSSFEFAPAD